MQVQFEVEMQVQFEVQIERFHSGKEVRKVFFSVQFYKVLFVFFVNLNSCCFCCCCAFHSLFVYWLCLLLL